MSYFLKWAILGFFLILLCPVVYAIEDTEWISYQKNCNQQWNKDQKGHHQHLGKAVCACMADSVMTYRANHKNVDETSKEYGNFYKQASQVCTSSGVLTNSASRANYYNAYDEPTIQVICRSSWVGLMDSFQPADAKFNSNEFCQCVGPKLRSVVADYDNLSPKEVRSHTLELVKKCDPTTTLSIDEYALLSQSAKPETSTPPSAKGKFILDIENNSDPKVNEIATYLRDDGRLKEIVAAMNQTLKIPYDVKIVTTVTEGGPHYTPKEKTIYLDYGIMALVMNLYDKAHPKESDKNRRHYFNNLNRFFLYHELGHALIDAYNLPVLGQEEDAADALSAVIALKYLPKGYLVLVDAADFFYLLDKLTGTEASDYWDEHALNKQRYYRLLCYAYGRSPQPVEQQIEHYYQSGLKTFIKERSDFCHYGFNETYYSWMLLLKPYLNADTNPLSDEN